MSNTELMDNIEKQSGIIGPDTEEVTGLNELKTVTASAKKSSLLERTWRPALAFIVGIVGGVAACKPSNQEVINPPAPAPILTPNTAETASDQLVIGKPTATEVSETEQAPTKGKVYFKEYSAQPKAGSLEQPIPEDINKLITEALKTSPTAMKAFSTENPDVQINTALFTYFQTSEAEGKNFKEYVMFKDGQKYIIAGFKRVITLDPKDQYHYEYRTTQGNQAFIDYKFFKHLSPQLEKDPTLAETLVGDINRVEEAILGNPYTGKRFKYDQENPDNLSKFLAIFAPKTASAAEVTSILSPTTTEVKPLPEIINNETVKFVAPPVEEVQKAFEKARSEGELKVPLPDVVVKDGISVIEVKNAKTGASVLVISASNEGAYTFPALLDGEISQIIAGRRTNFSGVGINTDSEENNLFCIFPPTTRSDFKQGQRLVAGQQVIEIDFNPNSQEGQIFIKFLNDLYPDAPQNTLAVIGWSKGLNAQQNLKLENILQTQTNNIVTVGVSSK